MLIDWTFKDNFKCRKLFDAVEFLLIGVLDHLCCRVREEILEKWAEQDHLDLLDFLYSFNLICNI